MENKKPKDKYIGKKFNKFTVLSYKYNGKGNKHHYLCRCKCGSEKYYQIHNILSGTKNCGCDRNHYARQIRKEKGRASYTRLYNECRGGAVKRKYSFELTILEFIEIIKKNCHYCGSTPKKFNRYVNRKDGKISSESAHAETLENAWIVANGVDRVDNKLGYFASNCVPCCTVCNRAKNDMDHKEFVNYLDSLVSFRSSTDNL